MTSPPAKPARAPTLQGTLSHAPSHTLALIADKSGVPVESLATLTVRQTSGPLYNAVLTYAALCDPPRHDAHQPLFVESYEDPSDSSDDDDDAAPPRPPAGARRGRRLLADLHALKGLPYKSLLLPVDAKPMRKRKAPLPNFKFALGETAIVWPPAPHLTADYLHAQRERKREARRRSASSAAEAPPSAADPATGREAEAGDSAQAAGKQPSTAVADEDGKKVIYISHYSMGEPKSSEMGGILVYRELLMVSADGPAVLRKFATEVIRWRIDKDHRDGDGDGSKFALHRFKTGRFGGTWESEGLKLSRPPSSVILSKGQMDAILTDVRKFVRPETKKWYIQHGLPHRRSYLFYGYPGTGKTSTIRAIASTFRLNCCYLSMTTAGFSNQTLGDALSEIPANALIVLEDVDSLFNEDRRNQQGGPLTFSGMLNALDGLISAEGVIVVMTTNHIERLDAALIRGGRVDRRFFFDQPTQEQVGNLFRSFYPDAGNDVVRHFSEAIFSREEGDEARSLATLQQLFIDQRDSTAEECLKAVPEFFEAHFPDGTFRKKQSFYT